MTDVQFNKLNDTLSQLVNAVTSLAERVGAIEDGVGRLDERVSALEGRVGTLENRFVSLEEKVDELSEQFILMRHDVTESNAVIIKRFFEHDKKFEQVDDEFELFKRQIDKRLETAHG